MDKNNTTPNQDLLDTRIEALLNQEELKAVSVQEKDPELDSLVSIAEKMISQSKKYPGAPASTSQQRLELMTVYRSTIQKNKEDSSSSKRFFTFFQNTTFKWAVAIGTALLIAVGAFLSVNNENSEILSGAAGQETTIIPLIALVLIAIGVTLYLLFWRKK